MNCTICGCPTEYEVEVCDGCWEKYLAWAKEEAQLMKGVR